MTEGHEALPSTLADHYQIDVRPDGQPEILGTGGMATVYLAKDLRHERRVAIKVLHPQLAAVIGADRFVTEIRVTAKLQHPHIVPLLDSGVADSGGELQGRPYYVMPLVEGETLAARLLREKRLPVDEAIRITEQVASALDYAHEHGIIHRDIKPSNILLSGGFALVVDFGLARAIDRAAEGNVSTVSGVAVGTPRYMSPEQGDGSSEVDGRTDVYSLGCVLYEMLAGVPPYTDASPYTLISRHRAAQVPPIRQARPELPHSIEEALHGALAKLPSERFATAGAFAKALHSGVKRRWLRGWHAGLAVGTLAVAATLVWLATRGSIEVRTTAGGPALDTLRYLVVPAEDSNATAMFHDGLERWTGISVVQPFQVQEAMARRGAPPDADGSRALARSLGAGRYIRLHVSPAGVRSRADAVLYESGRGTVVREASTSYGAGAGEADSALAGLVDHLLLGVAEPAGASHVTSGTRSLPARQAFLRGQAALAEWDLPRADSAFASAQRQDSDYSAAALWLAQVRIWGRASLSLWQVHAENAAAARARLSPDDRDRSDALLALSRGDITSACEAWRRSTERRPADFAGWYSLAICLAGDSVVVRDTKSRSGWRFRSSFAAAVKAYGRAFELLPTVHRAFRRESYEELQRLLGTSRSDVRSGWAAPPDTTWFLAFLAYEGDSLIAIPFPALQVMTRSSLVPATAMNEAEVRQRLMFRDIATNWARAYPTSPDVLEALAVALDLLGDPSSVDTMSRARLLTNDPRERTRVAVSEIWLRLKLSLPMNEAGLQLARKLADSLLVHPLPLSDQEALRLSGIAALTGHAFEASRLAAEAAALEASDMPLHLRRALRSHLVFASLGGPQDSLSALDRAVERGIDESLPATLRGPVGLDWALATTIVYPDYAGRGLQRLQGKGSELLDAQAAAVVGNLDPARKYLDELKKRRALVPPSNLGLDGLYSEARLIGALGDNARAAAWLDPTLTSLYLARPNDLSFGGRPGALVRAMAYRAELASSLGDTEGARRWARAVVILWSGADPFLQPLVKRMARLAG